MANEMQIRGISRPQLRELALGMSTSVGDPMADVESSLSENLRTAANRGKTSDWG
jgi:hypothetical protein